MGEGSGRRIASTFLWVYLAGLAFVLLNPSAELPSRLVGWMADVGHEGRLPDRLLLPERVEFVANSLVIVPATATMAWLWPLRSWTTWTAYGYVGAMAVEGVQAVLLPDRSATYVDVVSNTLGALIGAVAGHLLHRWSRGTHSGTPGLRPAP